MAAENLLYTVEQISVTKGTNLTDQVLTTIDGAIKDEAEIFRQFTINAGSTNFGGSGAGNADYAGKFNVLGLSLVGDAAKKIEIENTEDNGSAFATMSGYLVDT